MLAWTWRCSMAEGPDPVIREHALMKYRKMVKLDSLQYLSRPWPLLVVEGDDAASSVDDVARSGSRGWNAGVYG